MVGSKFLFIFIVLRHIHISCGLCQHTLFLSSLLLELVNVNLNVVCFLCSVGKLNTQVISHIVHSAFRLTFTFFFFDIILSLRGFNSLLGELISAVDLRH